MSLQDIREKLSKQSPQHIVIFTDGERDDWLACQMLAEYKAEHPVCKITLVFDHGNDDYHVSVDDRRQSLLDLCEQHGFTFAEGAASKKNLLAKRYQVSQEMKTVIDSADALIMVSSPVILFECMQAGDAGKAVLQGKKINLFYGAANFLWLAEYLEKHDVAANREAANEQVNVFLNELSPLIMVQNAMLEGVFAKVHLEGDVPAKQAIKSITPQGWSFLSAYIEDIESYGSDVAKAELLKHGEATAGIARKQAGKIAKYLEQNPELEFAFDQLDGESIVDALLRNANGNFTFVTGVKNFGDAHKDITRACSIFASTAHFPLQALIADQWAVMALLEMTGVIEPTLTRLLSEQSYQATKGNYAVYGNVPAPAEKDSAQQYHIDPSLALDAEAKRELAEAIIFTMTVLSIRAMKGSMSPEGQQQSAIYRLFDERGYFAEPLNVVLQDKVLRSYILEEFSQSERLAQGAHQAGFHKMPAASQETDDEKLTTAPTP